MTRARDELILSHAADYGGARARRVSPFVLEALDLPAAAGVPGAGAAAPTAAERLAAFEAQPRRRRRSPSGPIDEPLSLSFYQIDDYLTCPLKYKYAHVLRVPLAPHHAIIYGVRAAQGGPALPPAPCQGPGHVRGRAGRASFTAAWSNEGFVSREHEEARLEAGRAALRRFRRPSSSPDAVIPTYVEREFSFQLGGDRVRGRWDRVDVVRDRGRRRRPPVRGSRAAAASADVVSPTLEMLGPERVTITDYKSSDVRDPVKARQRARDSLQLQIYAMGYEAMTGRLPDAVALHFLESGLVGEVAGGPEAAGQGPRARSRPRRPACGRATTPRSRTTSPARTARSGTSARRASPADRAFARVDGSGHGAILRAPRRRARRRMTWRPHRPCLTTGLARRRPSASRPPPWVDLAAAPALGPVVVVDEDRREVQRIARLLARPATAVIARDRRTSRPAPGLRLERRARACSISAIEMTAMSGIELAARLSLARPGLRVLLMSSDPAAVDRARSHEALVHGVLLQPFTRDDCASRRGRAGRPGRPGRAPMTALVDGVARPDPTVGGRRPSRGPRLAGHGSARPAAEPGRVRGGLRRLDPGRAGRDDAGPDQGPERRLPRRPR